MSLETAEKGITVATSATRNRAAKTATATRPQGKQQGEPIKRSTSSVDSSSQAAIKLRKNLESVKHPRVQSTAVYSSSFYGLERKDSAFFSAKNSQVMLDKLINQEASTQAYQAPLIGCIPPSALKCFAGEKQEEEKAVVSSPSDSPAHAPSGMMLLLKCRLVKYQTH